MFFETCIAPVNIAVIKYWGKRDEKLILPINDSISITLSTDQMCAKTTAAASSEFSSNKFWLNGEEVIIEDNPRLLNCLSEIKSIAKAQESNKFPVEWKIHICSENNFPTAAGLASSAAGYACLVYTLAALYGLEKKELSVIARLGSGSACRSLYGGFVQWKKGEKENGEDSFAVQIATKSYWPELRVLVLVVSDSRKKISSSKGMTRSVKTSELLRFRAENCVPKRIAIMNQAIKEKNFEKFAEITMKDSNQFHATCLDTYPPCVYMNDISHSIVEFVHKYNEAKGDIQVCYTFDAGPNACLFLLEKNVSNVVKAINTCFPNEISDSVEYIKGIPIDVKNKDEFASTFPCDFKFSRRNSLQYIIHTTIGEGPMKLDKNESLLNDTGYPKSV